MEFPNERDFAVLIQPYALKYCTNNGLGIIVDYVQKNLGGALQWIAPLFPIFDRIDLKAIKARKVRLREILPLSNLLYIHVYRLKNGGKHSQLS